MKITFVVLGNPIPMPRARVVRLRNGRSHSFTPQAAVAAKASVRAAAESLQIPFFTGPVQLEVACYLPTEGITFWKRGSGDWDNFGKLVSDALEGVAYANDASIVRATVRKAPADKAGPRLEVTLEGNVGERPTAKPPRCRRLHSGAQPVPAFYRRNT